MNTMARLNTAIDNREIVRIGARAGRLVGTVGIALGYNANYHTVKIGFVDENGEYNGESTRIGANHIEYPCRSCGASVKDWVRS